MRGGLTDARGMRSGCRSDEVLPCDSGTRCRVVQADEDARPKPTLRTGASDWPHQLTEESISRLPAWKRYVLLGTCALSIVGVVPAVLAGALAAVCDTAGYWVLIPLYIALGCVMWRMVEP